MQPYKDRAGHAYGAAARTLRSWALPPAFGRKS